MAARFHPEPLALALLLLAGAVPVLLAGCGDKPVPGGGQENASRPSCAPEEPVRVGDAADPERVFREFLRLHQTGGLDSPRGKEIRTEEASSWKNSSRVPPDPVFDKIIRIDESNAVARVTVVGKKRTVNIYFYLLKTDEWRVRSMRALALTGLLEKMVEEYEADPSEIDALPEHPPPGTDEPTLTRSGAIRAIENAKLTLRSDQELIAWFRVHRTALEAIREAARLASTEESTRLAEVSSIKKLVEELNLTNASLGEGGRLELVIGGLVDNSVGFLAADPTNMPPITADDYIWVEEIEGGWFLFRTT